MSFFESQIERRLQYEADDFSDTFTDIAHSVMGEKSSYEYKSRKRIEDDAVNEMLRYFGEKPARFPDDIEKLKEKIDYASAPYGIMSRRVRLEGDWDKDACGVMITVQKDSGKTVTLVPDKVFGYIFYDGELKKYIKIDKHNRSLFNENAYLFYKPLPNREFTLLRLLQYILMFMSRSDIILWLLLCFGSIRIAFETPRITQLLFGSIVPLKQATLIPAAFVMLISVAVCSYFIDLQKNVVTKKMSVKASSRIKAAGMMQVMELPRSFFREYSPGDLASRIDLIGHLTEIVVDSIASALYAVITVIVCLNLTYKNYPMYIGTVIIVSVSTLVIFLVSVKVNGSLMTKRLRAYTTESGVTYDTILGIQKIHLTGAEKRAFTRWGKIFSERSELEYKPRLEVALLKIAPVVLKYIGLAGVFAVTLINVFKKKHRFNRFLFLFSFLRIAHERSDNADEYR